MSLAHTVLNLCPVEARLADPIRLLVSSNPQQTGAFDQAQFEALSRSFIAAGLRAPQGVTDAEALSTFDKIAHEALLTSKIEDIDLADPIQAIRQASQNSLASPRYRTPIKTADGTLLSVIHAGKKNGHRTVFFGAPGTPAELNNDWLKGFSEQGEVINWEMRGLFGDDFRSVEDLSVDAQLNDIETVMKAVGWQDSHVMGICGGAVLALAYAALNPERVTSLSLWFGDYELGDLAPKTDHQHNLKSLMKMVVEGQVKPQDMHSILWAAMHKFSRPQIAPLVLYPFASPELLFQYCRMNYAIMNTDCGPISEKVDIPCSVFYSPFDQTTHPEGSRVIARRLGARLQGLNVSGHMDVLQGNRQDVEKVIAFQKSSLWPLAGENYGCK